MYVWASSNQICFCQTNMDKLSGLLINWTTNIIAWIMLYNHVIFQVRFSWKSSPRLIWISAFKELVQQGADLMGSSAFIESHIHPAVDVHWKSHQIYISMSHVTGRISLELLPQLSSIHVPCEFHMKTQCASSPQSDRMTWLGPNPGVWKAFTEWRLLLQPFPKRWKILPVPILPGVSETERLRKKKTHESQQGPRCADEASNMFIIFMSGESSVTRQSSTPAVSSRLVYH